MNYGHRKWFGYYLSELWTVWRWSNGVKVGTIVLAQIIKYNKKIKINTYIMEYYCTFHFPL